mmetsp:Transcript_3945/g.13810  ORF Transcript_3945/g.13810 Transcript_3945/m.13810 type:complete len:247 (+) Transcript_3945:599-1339(+)
MPRSGTAALAMRVFVCWFTSASRSRSRSSSSSTNSTVSTSPQAGSVPATARVALLEGRRATASLALLAATKDARGAPPSAGRPSACDTSTCATQARPPPGPSTAPAPAAASSSWSCRESVPSSTRPCPAPAPSATPIDTASPRDSLAAVSPERLTSPCATSASEDAAPSSGAEWATKSWHRTMGGPSPSAGSFSAKARLRNSGAVDTAEGSVLPEAPLPGAGPAPSSGAARVAAATPEGGRASRRT